MWPAACRFGLILVVTATNFFTFMPFIYYFFVAPKLFILFPVKVQSCVVLEVGVAL